MPFRVVKAETGDRWHSLPEDIATLSSRNSGPVPWASCAIQRPASDQWSNIKSSDRRASASKRSILYVGKKQEQGRSTGNLGHADLELDIAQAEQLCEFMSIIGIASNRLLPFLTPVKSKNITGPRERPASRLYRCFLSTMTSSSAQFRPKGLTAWETCRLSARRDLARRWRRCGPAYAAPL